MAPVVTEGALGRFILMLFFCSRFAPAAAIPNERTENCGARSKRERVPCYRLGRCGGCAGAENMFGRWLCRISQMRCQRRAAVMLLVSRSCQNQLAQDVLTNAPGKRRARVPEHGWASSTRRVLPRRVCWKRAMGPRIGVKLTCTGR
jgi:hypothetical protein